MQVRGLAVAQPGPQFVSKDLNMKLIALNIDQRKADGEQHGIGCAISPMVNSKEQCVHWCGQTDVSTLPHCHNKLVHFLDTERHLQVCLERRTSSDDCHARGEAVYAEYTRHLSNPNSPSRVESPVDGVCRGWSGQYRTPHACSA